MQDEYQEAADLARMALDAFKQLDGAGDKAKAARDFKGAVRYWQEAEHALTDSLRQRQHELRFRKDEFELYNHLDDDYNSKDNHNGIKYCERRLKKLKFDSRAVHIKSCLAHLEDKTIQLTEQIKANERIIINEDLRSKAKGFKHNNNHSNFGGSWQQMSSGWPNNHRPHMRNDGQHHARRLAYLEKAIDKFSGMVNTMVNESKRWEDDWQELVNERRIFDKECERLDDAARRHHARLPPRDYAAEDQATAARLEEMAAARRQRELDRQKNLEAEIKIKTEEIEEQKMQDIEEENKWEAEYGEALEDPAFIQPLLPQRSLSQSSADKAIPSSDPEAGQQEERAIQRSLQTPEQVDGLSPENNGGEKVVTSGWEADPNDRNTGWGWNPESSHQEPSNWELDYKAANSIAPSVDELDFDEDAIQLD